ncbi:hypothetical protein [Thalassomonas sp. RHCl1]|uniref:COG3014 family protein n=1 Tax=Thalassomonas sp. RHCl1 TaxID=2995320 RepID=UPI00248C246B|nr:hypothetical protein [Thalassomonas sp. RHCl1]
MVKNKKQLLVCVFLFFSLSACTSVRFKDFFVGYAEQMKPVRLSLSQGDVMQANKALGGRNAVDDILYQLEQGRLSYLANDWQNSKAAFDAVYRQVELDAGKAKYRASRGLQQLGAVVGNDNVIAYQLPAYEQTMMHSYQAMNYLYQHNLEGALVEIRRANQVQEKALKQHRKELLDAEQALASGSDDDEVNPDWHRINQAYAGMDAVIGEVKNGFQNAYTFYLSGLLYEAAGQENDAYIDYKRALEISPDNGFLQQDVLRLASALGMQDDLVRFEQKYGAWQQKHKASDGQVVVIYEQGLINEKKELALHLPVSTSDNDLRFYNLALPVYEKSPGISHGLQLKVDNRTLNSMELVRLQGLAAKQLQEQLPGLIIRQLSRLIAKEKFRSTLERKGDDVGNILANLYNLVSEKADTRSWVTLPKNSQLVKAQLPAGKQQLELVVDGRKTQIELEVKANRTTLVNLTKIDNFMNYQTVNL